MERGVFLRVTSDDWKYDEEYIKSLPRSSQKYPLKHFYSLVELLEERGMMNLNPEEESNAIIESQVSKFPKIRSSEETPPGVDTPSGFEVIFHSLQFNQERVPSIENIFGEWTYVDSFNKSDYV